VSDIPQNRWFSAEEFAEELGIKARWLEDRCAPSWPEHDRLPHQRVGRLLRFAPEDRAEIKAMFKRVSQSTAVVEPIDLGRGIAGIRRLKQLQASQP